MKNVVISFTLLILLGSCGIHPDPKGNRLASFEVGQIELPVDTDSDPDRNAVFGFTSRTEPVRLRVLGELPNDWQKLQFYLQAEPAHWWHGLLLPQWPLWLNTNNDTWYAAGDTDILAMQLENIFDQRETIFLLADYKPAEQSLVLTPHHQLHPFTRYNLYVQDPDGERELLSTFTSATAYRQISGNNKIWQAETIYGPYDPANPQQILDPTDPSFTTKALYQIERQLDPNTMLERGAGTSGVRGSLDGFEFNASFSFDPHASNADLYYYRAKQQTDPGPLRFSSVKMLGDKEAVQLFWRTNATAENNKFREDNAYVTRAIYQAYSEKSHVFVFYESVNGENGQFWQTLEQMNPVGSIVIQKDERNRMSWIARFNTVFSLAEADANYNSLPSRSPEYYYQYHYAQKFSETSASYTSQRTGRFRYVRSNGVYRNDRREEEAQGNEQPGVWLKEVSAGVETTKAQRLVNKKVGAFEGIQVKIYQPFTLNQRTYYGVQYKQPTPL